MKNTFPNYNYGQTYGKKNQDLLAIIAMFMGLMLAIFLLWFMTNYRFEHLLETRNNFGILLVWSLWGPAIASFFAGLYRCNGTRFAYWAIFIGMMWFATALVELVLLSL